MFWQQDQSNMSGMQSGGNPMSSFFQSGNPPYTYPSSGYQNGGNFMNQLSTSNSVPSALSSTNTDKVQTPQFNQSMPMMQPYQGFQQQQQQQQPFQFPQSYQMNPPYQFSQFQQPTSNTQYQPHH